jgi:Cu2+-exporting ATPase
MQTAALALDTAVVPIQWAALDEPAEWQSFSRPVDARQASWESYLAIEGMYCPACSLTVEQALLGSCGVESAQVNGATATARVVWSPQAGRPSDWLAALRRAGYAAVPAADLLAAVPRIRAQRLLLWRWLVAGFCMMQVMMYAVPAYVAEPGDITPDIQALLRWASWLLTLPVLLFSCRPFFQSAWRDLRHARVGMDVPVSLGLLIAFAASSAATFDPAGPLAGEVWFDSITMFVFFLLSGRLLEQRLRDRTAGSLESLARRLPDTVERQADDGAFERVAVRRLAHGDRIRILPGEVFPVDGTVLHGEGRVDEALLTGESRPLLRGPGQRVVSGSHNLSGVMVVRVERIGPETRFAEIVALMERASVDKPRLARLADRIAGPFLAGVLLASAAAAAWWWPAGAGPAISVAVAVLIVTCPCALSLAAPAATLAAAGALARRGILVRHLQALEGAAGVDTVVFDKTGTLTEQRMVVVGGCARVGVAQTEALAMAAALAQHSLHPASRAIAAAAGAGAWTASTIQEITGRGLEGEVSREGGADVVRRLRLGSAPFCGVAASSRVASSQLHLADAEGWVATFDLEEALRPDAVPTIESLRRSGLDVELLSGDRAAPVARVASRAGIEASRGLQSPQDKLARVEQLQQQGGRIAMVGDGMNDGPVLARADVSIAMGHGVPLAQSRADFVVLGEQLGGVAALLLQARRTRNVVRQNLAWACAYNAVCVPLAVAGLMPPWLAGLGMAASSLLVVLNSARLARIPGDR